MRYLGIALVILSLPAFIAILNGQPSARKWAYAAIGILPFTINAINLDAALISWAGWPGYAKGIVVTLLDTLALAVILTARRPLRRLPFLGLFIAYTLAVSVTVMWLGSPMSSSFYAFQLVRCLIVFVAVATVVGRPGGIRWIAFGLAAGAIFQGLTTIEQRFGGAFQAAGTMGHQNLLGLMLHFVTLPLLAILLGGERSRIVKIGLGASLLAVALGASRGAIGFSVIGIALLVLLSLARRPTPQKWRIIGLSAILMLVVTPVVVGGLEQRFASGKVEGSDEERVAFERAAKMMLADHPMGIGANQYVVVSNTGGYARRAGVTLAYANLSSNVHNIYLLVASETGWLGLFTFVALFSWPIVQGLRFAFADRRDPRGETVLGATVALVVVAAHGLYEWIFVTYQAQYVFAIGCGLIAGCMRERALEKRIARRTLLASDPAGGHRARLGVAGPAPAED